ncbi:MAG: hypothetical protein UX86_C0035G0017 [Candidatus Amesbacteria bacterium GW2011_GWC1_47_15]|uniref:Uncharacterized protein n=2 Tax=Candidatus Amesiibacteriota TaxID=1752730 RepID=A0A0G1S146_9BACT|nr:MAG: hypothetical protein UX86_C0035G0017 [Candidatus Amesbacteria bacterium GW2011_GWC1_47_15]KKU97084.1 MAG: hypothetical protein UY28_C0027G0012 [Candidatus Amesbacteria bacterium GW2011_GWB1_48_13]
MFEVLFSTMPKTLIETTAIITPGNQKKSIILYLPSANDTKARNVPNSKYILSFLLKLKDLNKKENVNQIPKKTPNRDSELDNQPNTKYHFDKSNKTKDRLPITMVINTFLFIS